MIFKQIPTMISDLDKLGIALKSLDAMKIGTVGVNIANVEAYRTALKGLSVEQSVFALASKGATEEQIRQILIINEATAKDVEAAIAKAGLTTATKALTQAEMIEIATKNGVAKAEAEELLRKIGITATEEGQVAVKKQVTLAMLEQAVASGNLTAAESTQIATMLGLNAVETTNIGITNVLTASFTKLWAVITAHPIGAILTAIGAVAVGTIAYINKTNKDAKKALIEAHETAQQALEDTKTSLSDDKSELQSVNSELETTKQKIQEISSIGAPTLVEQNELSKLSISNAQLEIQRTLLENNIKLKQKSAALDAKELLGTQVEMEYADILDGSSIESHNESYSYKDHAKYQASNLKNAYNIYMKALREGDVKKQQLAQELIAASAGDSATLTSELLEIIESFKYEDGTVIEGYEKIYNEYMGLIYNLQSLTNPDTFLDIAKSVTSNTGIDYEKVISDAYKLAFEGNFDIDKLNQDFVKALSDAGIDESTIDYIFSVKQQEYQLLVDKINEKYKVSETPDKIRQDYWDANGNIHSEYIDVDEETKKQITEINTVNERLNEYAKENPIEFQLVSSFDEDFETLDKYIEEERIKAENTTDYIGDYITNAIKRIYDEAKVQSSTFNFENPISISTALTNSQESLDQFQSSVKSASEAYTTLLSGNYSSSELLDSIQTINEAVTDMKGFIDWEEIDSLDLLGDKLEDISKSYAESILSVAGINVGSDFGQILTNIIQQMYEVEAQFTGMNTQLDNLQSSYKTVTDVLESYNETGYISLDNLQSLLTADENLIAMLEVENGKLTINQEAYENLVAVQLQEFKEKLNNAAAAEIETLALSKAEEATNNNAHASEDAAAKLDAETEAFKRNTEAAGENAVTKAITKAKEAGVSKEEIKGVLDKYTKIWNAAMDNYSKDFPTFMDGAKSSASSAGEDAGKAFTEALDKELNALDTKMEAGYIDFNDYIQARLDLIEDYYRKGKIKADEYYSYLEKHYDTQITYMDKAASAVTRRIDKEIDALEKQKDDVESIYQVQIDALEKQKTLLEEATKERQQQIDLQKALYDMERAENQRTKLVNYNARHYSNIVKESNYNG